MSSNDNFLQINTKTLTYTVYSEIRCIALLILQTSIEILGFSVPSIILVKAGLMEITLLRARPAWLRMTLDCQE